MPEPRVLLFDVEIAASVGYYWPGSRYQEGAIIANKEPAYTLTFAYKWLGEGAIHVRALPDYPEYKKDPKSDKSLVSELRERICESDLLCTHNGNSFDIPWVNTRCLINGLPPLPPVKSIDTCQASKKLKLESRKLDNIGHTLQLGRKRLHVGWPLWEACMSGDMTAYREMKKYNVQDVRLLESVYMELRPFIAHPRLTDYTKTHACPVCLSEKKIQKRGTEVTKTGHRQRFQCQSCGKYFSGLKHVRDT